MPTHHPHIHAAILFGPLARGTARTDGELGLAEMARGPLTAGERLVLVRGPAQVLGRPMALVDLSVAGEPLHRCLEPSLRGAPGDAAIHCAVIARRRSRRGNPGPADPWIAALAMTWGVGRPVSPVSRFGACKPEPLSPPGGNLGPKRKTS